jgi:hypothetical protein
MASRQWYQDAGQPGLTRRVAPNRSSTGTPSAAVLRLQGSIGNQSVARLLQRSPDSPATADAVEAWSADYTNATTYVIEDYERIRAFQPS